MEGRIVSFRRSRHHFKARHYILDFGLKKEEAAKLIGKDVKWTSPSGKEIKGRIVATHGNKGLVRAIFEKGLPGQAVNQAVSV